MNTAKASGQSPESRQTEASLDRRYGRIAISAVVATLPYRNRSEAKKQAYVPVEARETD
ncbi:hypothetical protein [Pseudorhodoplanes sinuspersici]|uniref:hypothetical protein n=1 Tax=Pseudorhodoplanes sinuspersici TaxID=1235591 RepID=UPI0012FE16FF|nr:hypothetical protein [Pseudorhodoplanes sinuspersici]